jgi:3alpha(or 20beta)-hydroxysteroid dehydrogenase
MRLVNHVALITGAARGSGAAHARAFIAEGAKVVLADVLDDEGKALSKELGKNALYLHLDVSSEADWIKAVAAAEAQLGTVSVLVNNAGIVHSAPLDEYPLESWERVIGIDLTGTFLGMKAVSFGMKKARRGSIINISSIMGLRGAAHSYAYVAAKWGVRGLTKSAAIELGVHGIRVNTVLPGFIDTAMTVKDDPAALEIPLGRAAKPEELAKTIVFLASDESSFTTGAELCVDGGQTTNIPLYDRLHGVFLSGPRKP